MADDEQRDERRADEPRGAAARGRGASAEEPAAEEPEPRSRRPRSRSAEPSRGAGVEDAAGEDAPEARRGAAAGRRRGRAAEEAEAARQGPEDPEPRTRRHPGRRPRADHDRARARAERRGAGPPRGRGGGARPPEAEATAEAGDEPAPRASPRRSWRARRASRPPASARARSPASSCAPAAASSRSTSAASRSSSRAPCTRRSCAQPLLTSGYEGNVDVRVRVHGGGITGQAGAVRHGIARALTEIDPELRGELKRRGFLTRDARVKERRKAGLKKARKRPQFSASADGATGWTPDAQALRHRRRPRVAGRSSTAELGDGALGRRRGALAGARGASGPRS